MRKSILFVCMGNICRSAAAEGVLKKMANDKELNILIDSAGTIGYHIGERADSRMIEFAFERGYRLDSISRQVRYVDFEDFDEIIAMDENNIKDLKSLIKIHTKDDIKLYNKYVSKITKMVTYCSDEFISANKPLNGVPDPYYGGANGFKHVMDILENACINIIKKYCL